MSIIKVNNSSVLYDDKVDKTINDYYKYCLNIIKEDLSIIDTPLNVLFCKDNYNFSNNNRTIKIGIQYEHTIVKDGGRDVLSKYYGKIKYDDNNFYLVRIHDYYNINKNDIIIEYSNPNIYNIRESGHFNDFYKKIVYIPPFLYDQDFISDFRDDTIVIFNYNCSDRRAKFLSDADNLNINIKKIDNFFGYDKIKELYKKTKILVNIHQTDHHHTFEELRILPALLNGVIVISEDVPLKECIPYSEYIVWSTYDNINDKIIEIQNNYDYYYNKIFNNNLKNILYEMKKNNKIISI